MSGDTEPENTLVVLFVAIFSGALITYVLSRYYPEAPYTVAVFAVGLIVSAIFGNGDGNGSMDQSLQIWEYVSPNIILYTFLPALLFGEAMSLNFQHIRGSIGNATLLAGPGAVFGAFATAAMAKWCFSYNWSWHLCFVFGAILCATDPVAVVALLKKVGASNKLTYIIIGEALINDGTALVLYNLLYSLIQTDPDIQVTPTNIFLYFLKVIIASPLLGLAYGAVALYLLSIANRRMKDDDTTIQMAITLVTAYISFYSAEYQCGISGVISCCTAGVLIARFGNPLILRPESLHSIWSAFEWLGNTIIFFLAAIIICLRSTAYIVGEDVGYLILTYIGAFIIRALMMVLFQPAMAHIGKGCTRDEAVFITWSGLRGAVSISLALSLVQNAENGDTTISTHDAHRVLFIVGGLAAMTLTFNATTTSALLRRLGLMQSADSEGNSRIMYSYAKKSIRLRAFKLLEQVLADHPDKVDPDFVIKSCSIMSDFDDASLAGVSSLTHAPAVTTTRTTFAKTDKVAELKTLRPAPLQGQFSTASQSFFSPASTLSTPTSAPSPVAPQAEKEDVTGRMLARHRAASLIAGASLAPAEGYDNVMTDTIANIVLTRDKSRAVYQSSRQNFRARSLTGKTGPQVVEDMLHAPPAALPAMAPLQGNVMGEIRRAFLNVVRKHYWRQINSGRLPRKSNSALSLLNSIDVALESTHEQGLQDWKFLVTTRAKLFKDVLQAFHENSSSAAVNGASNIDSNPLLDSRSAAGEEDSISTSSRGSSTSNPMMSTSSPSRWKNPAPSVADRGLGDFYVLMASERPAAQRIEDVNKFLRDYRCSQAVYLLTSFIEAHRYAQRKIPFFLGRRDDAQSSSLEEKQVIDESQEEVRQATEILECLHPTIVRRQLSKVAVRWILHMQEDCAESFLGEGVITEEQAEELFNQAVDDLKSMKDMTWHTVVVARLRYLYERVLGKSSTD